MITEPARDIKKLGWNRNAIALAALSIFNLIIIISVWWFISNVVFFARTVRMEADNGSSASLSVATGTPTILMNDASGQTRLDLGLTGLGDPLIRMLDANGVTVVSIDVNTSGRRPRIILRDPESRDIIWQSPIDEP